MDLLDSMKVYVLTVDKGSLSAAAAACDISATMAGNHLRMLERRLGMQLLHRTTRRQSLTAFGEEYYARVRSGFIYEAGMRPDRFQRIDATPDVDAVQKAIRREVARLLRERGWNVRE